MMIHAYYPPSASFLSIASPKSVDNSTQTSAPASPVASRKESVDVQAAHDDDDIDEDDCDIIVRSVLEYIV